MTKGPGRGPQSVKKGMGIWYLGGEERCKSQNLYSKKILEEVEEKENTEDHEGNNNTTKTRYTKTNYIT